MHFVVAPAPCQHIVTAELKTGQDAKGKKLLKNNKPNASLYLSVSFP